MGKFNELHQHPFLILGR